MPVSVDTTGFDANSGHVKDRADPRIIFDGSGKSVFGGGTLHHGQATVNGSAVLRVRRVHRLVRRSARLRPPQASPPPIYNIRIGSLRTVAGDTARLVLTGPAQTAIADIGTLSIIVVVRNVGAAGVLQGTAWWDHTGTAVNTTTSGTGFANDSTGHVQGTSAGFDNSAMQGLYVGLSTNSGASGVWTVTQCQAEADW